MMRRALIDQQANDWDWVESPSQLRARSDAEAVRPNERPERDDTLPHTAKSRPASAPRRSLRSGLGYALLGFFLGAIFWHFVGFWDFVGQLMFKGATTGTEIVQGPPVIKLRERVSGASAITLVAASDTCTMLQLDRATGETLAVPCAGEPLPLRSIKAARREDLRVTATQRLIETTARGWGVVTVESPSLRTDQASAD